VAQAKLRELELAEKSGRLVPLADVVNAVSQSNRNIRDRFLQFPPKMTARLFGVSDRLAFKAALETEVRDLLTELGTTTVAFDSRLSVLCKSCRGKLAGEGG
jgi:hypothetical protein